METRGSVLFKDENTLTAHFVCVCAWFNICSDIFIAKVKGRRDMLFCVAGIGWISTEGMFSNYLTELSAVPRAKMGGSVYLKFKTSFVIRMVQKCNF